MKRFVAFVLISLVISVAYCMQLEKELHRLAIESQDTPCAFSFDGKPLK